MIPVNFTVRKYVVNSDNWSTQLNALWYLDIGAIQERLQSIGYSCAVSRNFSYNQVEVRFFGFPDYFRQTLSNQNDWYYQAELDVETATAMAHTGMLNATTYQTPVTPIQTQIQPAINAANNAANTIYGYLPNANDTATILGLSTPVIAVSAVLLLLLLVKK